MFTRNRIKGAPYPYRRGHKGRNNPPYTVDAETGCWVWNRADYGNGYGVVLHEGRNVPAHRVYFEKCNGPIPPGHDVHHRCVEEGFGTTLCVNPEHLQAFTRGAHRRRDRRVLLSPEKAREIRRLRSDEGLTFPEIARRFGIATTTVSGVVHNRIWRE